MLSKGQELRRTLWKANRAGALTPGAVFIDGAHIKAGANLNRKIKQEVPAAAARYREELAAEINADRESHGKKPFDDDDELPRPTPPATRTAMCWKRWLPPAASTTA